MKPLDFWFGPQQDGDFGQARAQWFRKDSAFESAGSFNTLVVALKTAGLVETLKGKGPFTVFAPNDAAFAKIPKEQLDALLADKGNGVIHVIDNVVMPK
jgi:uncharacterized surface protein with fasciclin (FAS1) repeats